MHSNTNLVASRAVKREKVSLPVNERRLKTKKLPNNLPNNTLMQLYSQLPFRKVSARRGTY